MIKVKNEKINLSIKNNGKEIKNITFQNTVTDQYLDMIIYYMLPQTIADTLFPDIIVDTSTSSPFYVVGLDFSTPKQTITNESVTAFHNYGIYRNGLGTTTYLENGKEVVSNYYITTFSDQELLQYLFFFSTKGEEDRLTSYIDVSSFGVYGSTGFEISFTRFDKITSNEIPLQTLTNSYDFLPRIETNLFVQTYINKITTYFDYDVQGNYEEYSIYDLSFSKISAGVVEISGFKNFYIGTYDYPQEDYPQDDYPQEQGQFKSVKFTYSNGVETYVNIKDLDITYNNKEVKIKLKCERGVY